MNKDVHNTYEYANVQPQARDLAQRPILWPKVYVI